MSAFLQLLVSILMWVHWGYLALNAVNVPFAEEWVLAIPRTGGFNWEYFSEWNNDSRMFWTKILYYLNYNLFGLNFKYQAIANFLIWWGILWGTFRIFVKAKMNPSLVWLSLVPAVSAIAMNNHIWAIQSQWNLSQLFLVLAILCWGTPIIAGGLLVGAMYSFSHGAVFAIAAGVWMLFEAVREKKQMKGVIALFVFCMFYLWIQNHHTPPNHPSYTYPWNGSFWTFFNALMSFALGFVKQHDVWSALGALGFLAIFWSWFRFDQNIKVFSFCLFAALGAISLARAGFGPMAAKVSRYHGTVVFVLPLIHYALSVVSRKPKIAWAVALFVVFNHLPHFNFSPVYRDAHESLSRGLKCVQNNPESVCPEVFPDPLVGPWGIAKKYQMSFVK